jgi:hypothetical protein
MLVFWDHGSGWSGYGLDHTCTTTSTYSQASGCNMLTLQALAQGMQVMPFAGVLMSCKQQPLLHQQQQQQQQQPHYTSSAL